MKEVKGKSQVDWIITIVPFAFILALGVSFFAFPEASSNALQSIRYVFGDTFGVLFLIFGLFVLAVALFLAFSKYGNIVLGAPNEKPKYSFWTWGAMMFTSGLAADILFYSFAEWVMYSTNKHVQELGGVQEWAGVFPLFHWSFIPWAFYLVLAVAFGFMLHVRQRNKQKFSEACRPIIGKYADKIPGRIIDLLAVFALLAGTATTFSIATPLMSKIIISLFHINVSQTAVTIVILLITCFVYTFSLLHGFKGIGILAKLCIYLFGILLLIVLFLGGNTEYIVETGFESFGRMVQNFIGLATYTDPMRTTNFAQDWTIYYWAYWMVWCVAAPFFIGNISRGRTIRQTVLGGFVFGVGSTIFSFIILGNYGMGLQVSGEYDFIGKYVETGDIYEIIISVIDTLPIAPVIECLILVTMIAFYSTSFDSIAYTASCYSYKKLENNKEPDKRVQFMWCILLIILPIALVFSESSMNSLQSVSIISAFPLGFVMLVIIIGFFRDAGKYINERKNKKE